jgi:aerobic carbon-monoxide dehydrogenase large subunit
MSSVADPIAPARATGERWIGVSVPRREDARLLRGEGRFVDDIDSPGMLHMAVARCPYPHARLEGIDVSDAIAMPGVVSVLTGSEVVRRSRALGVLRPLPGMPVLPFFAMADGVALYEGQPVASVVATSRAVAEDAVDALMIGYDPLPHVANADQALANGAPLVWPHLGSNLAAATQHRHGDPDACFAGAHATVGGQFRIGRVTGLPMETRAVLAEWSAAERSLTLLSSTQVPHLLRMQLAEALDLPEPSVRVVAPDVGGGFGLKLGIYPEDVLASLHAVRARRPVKWVEDRLEHFQATTHARESAHHAAISVTSDGTLTALRDDYVIDMGAYNSSFGPPMLTNLMLPGPYRLTAARIERRIAITNKPPTGAYRGYGQPESNFVREVLVDRAARALGLDPVEFRLRNLLQPEDLPFRSATGAVYDSGDYPAALERAVAAIRDHAARHEPAPGRAAGVGVASFLEMTGYPGSQALGESGARFGAYESVTLRANRAGGIDLYTGVSSFGQATETSFAQVCASVLGIDPGDVTIHPGDTAGTPYNVGGFASRTTIAGTGAILRAGHDIRAKVLRIAAHLIDADATDLEIADGVIRHRNKPECNVGFAEVVRAALTGHRLPPGEDPGLEATAYFDPPASAFGSGAAAALVEVDPVSGDYKVVRFVLSHDCGREVNPMLVAGQVLGGIVQGYGAAVFEELSYDPDSGQLMNGTMADYLIPTAADVPPVELIESNVPSPVTPLGVRGVGEAGTIPVAAAIANAICDALYPLAVEISRVPLTPESIWHAVERARDIDPWP